MTPAPELAAELAANPTSPAVRAKVALHLVEELVAAEVKPSGALWALQAVLPDLRKAAYWLERREVLLKMNEEELRARLRAETEAEAREGE